jgi:hypothetical protein
LATLTAHMAASVLMLQTDRGFITGRQQERQ